MILASGCVASSPNSVKAFDVFCESFKKSGKVAIIRPAKEMSFETTLMFDDAVNDFIIGNSECVANAGASSVFV